MFPVRYIETIMILNIPSVIQLESEENLAFEFENVYLNRS